VKEEHGIKRENNHVSTSASINGDIPSNTEESERPFKRRRKQAGNESEIIDLTGDD
jgi:hypothetical protein